MSGALIRLLGLAEGWDRTPSPRVYSSSVSRRKFFASASVHAILNEPFLDRSAEDCLSPGFC